MKRARNFVQWVAGSLAATGVLAMCIAAAFWESVILGRSCAIQLGLDE